MALCDSHSGSHWLSLPLSGILWPSLAHYCSLISRIQPLIGSQGPCSALIADATMTHFIPLWYTNSQYTHCKANRCKLMQCSLNNAMSEGLGWQKSYLEDCLSLCTLLYTKHTNSTVHRRVDRRDLWRLGRSEGGNQRRPRDHERPLPCEFSCLVLCLLIMSGCVSVYLWEYVD